MEEGRTRTIVVPNAELFANVTRLLGEGKSVTITCKGVSMLPLIRGGRDLVVVEKKEAYRPGDIVLFSIKGNYILHRIVAMDADCVTARGDGNWRGTERFTPADIHGKVVGIRRISRKGKERFIDPDSGSVKRFVKFWDFLFPVRRWILAVYRRLPWNRWLTVVNRNVNA